MVTELERRLIGQIELSGPVSVADFMAACLYHPEHGYYNSREPFGRRGDFITAPEISQMFGELLAVWAVTTWRNSGKPAPFVFAEIGPGRGSLMQDMLRVLKGVASDFLEAAMLHMVETSPRLRAIQRETLGTDGKSVEWLDSIDRLPPLPIILIGNEIFDAIPIRQFVKTGGNWLERMVGMDENGRLSFVAGMESIPPDLLPEKADNQPEGTIFEVAHAREQLAGSIARHVTEHGGAALFFDYGHLEPGFGDTLQAVRRHRHDGLFVAPGEADLTAHVDFAALSMTCRQAGASSSVMKQGDFLLKMGLLERAGVLGANRSTEERNQLSAAVERLAGPDQMGNLFKVLVIFSGDRQPFPFPPSNER